MNMSPELLLKNKSANTLRNVDVLFKYDTFENSRIIDNLSVHILVPSWMNTPTRRIWTLRELRPMGKDYWGPHSLVGIGKVDFLCD